MIKNLAKHVWNNRSTFAERSVKPSSTTLSTLPTRICQVLSNMSRALHQMSGLMNEKMETKSGECKAIKKLVTSMSSYGK